MKQDANLPKCARRGDLAKVRELLASGVNPDSRDDEGSTALICAAQEGNLELVRLLLGEKDPQGGVNDGSGVNSGANNSHRANVNAQDDYGATALVFAVNEGFVEVATYLLEHGADPDLKDKDGDTARTLLEHANSEMKKLFRSGLINT